MKAVILAGGYGTRLAEETSLRPKPMVEIGGMPILWHIMKIYSHHGITDFIICLGYKGYYIKEFFLNYYSHRSDLTIDLCNNVVTHHNNACEPWKVTLVDTGEGSMTGGRLKRVGEYLDGEDFCFTYGDGVADIDVSAAVDFHKQHGLLATMTAVQPPGRFGSVVIENERAVSFLEKPRGDSSWINGGYFVLSPKVLDYIENDASVWEQTPLMRLSGDGQLATYRHRGFWQCMDTLRDKMKLEDLWEAKKAPWAKW